MTANYKAERPPLIFPEANAYSVDEVLDFISVVVFPVDPDLHQVDKKAEYRKEYKEYLIERLLEAVVDRQFELWDTYLGKVVAPPTDRPSIPAKLLVDSRKTSAVKSFWLFLTQKFSKLPEPGFMKVLETPVVAPHKHHSRPRYKTSFWWARMTCILKPDLVKFCNAERFIVTFEGEGEQTSTQTSSHQAITEPENKTSVVSSEINVVPTTEPSQTTVDQPVQQLASESSISRANPKRNSKPKNKSKLVDDSIMNFEFLPDSAFVQVEVVAALFGCSIPTVWRRVRNGELVSPHHLGKRTTRWLVGEIRKALKKSQTPTQ